MRSLLTRAYQSILNGTYHCLLDPPTAHRLPPTACRPLAQMQTNQDLTEDLLVSWSARERLTEEVLSPDAQCPNAPMPQCPNAQCPTPDARRLMPNLTLSLTLTLTADPGGPLARHT